MLSLVGTEDSCESAPPDAGLDWLRATLDSDEVMLGGVWARLEIMLGLVG